MATEVSQESGKSAFVRETLAKNPKANPKVVNAAWKAAGNRDPISSSLVHKVRSTMGLTGNLRAKAGAGKAAGAAKPPVSAEPKRRGRPPKSSLTATPANGVSTTVSAKKVHAGERRTGPEELEGQVDLLVFKIMGVWTGDVEEALRKSRLLIPAAGLMTSGGPRRRNRRGRGCPEGPLPARPLRRG